jgi:DNA helicase-4
LCLQEAAVATDRRRTAVECIDKLIASWPNFEKFGDYYVNTLARGIVAGNPEQTLTPQEVELADELRDLLDEEEWQQLPALVERRRTDPSSEIKSDRRRAETKRRLDEEEAAAREEADRAAREIEEHAFAVERATTERHHRLTRRLSAAFEANFLRAADVFAADPDRELIGHQGFHDLRGQFVRDWTARELGDMLDDDQSQAVAAVDGNLLVRARAGSGKTRVLVDRGMFLIKHCGVRPTEMILLTFNRAAADEMKRRLAEHLGDGLPHVMTFHALAHALVHPNEQLLYDDDAGQPGLSRAIQEVIDEHIRDAPWGARIQSVMLRYFREDWEEIIRRGSNLSMEPFLEYRRGLTAESLRGDFVKSAGEKIVANALFEHGVTYRYEQSRLWNGVNYRPDFTIPSDGDGGVIIEYFGLTGDPEYDAMTRKKRAYWRQQDGWTLLEFFPRNLQQHGPGGFAAFVIDRIRDCGVPAERLSEDEIWSKISDRAVDRFTGTVRNFIKRCRTERRDPESLAEIVAGHVTQTECERDFLEVCNSIYSGYLDRLASRREEDFDGLIWRAVDLIRSSQTEFARDRNRERGDLGALRFMMIDEFQDFSIGFSEMVGAVRNAAPSMRVSCTGDDWQAINAFAGSSLRHFEQFLDDFATASAVDMRTNYRSAPSIVAAGNAVMADRGTPSRAHRQEEGEVRVAVLEHFLATPAENAQHSADDFTPAVLRIVADLLGRDLDVTLLSRSNTVWDAPRGATQIEDFLAHLRRRLPEATRPRLTISTAHGYKGRENGAVVILDAVSRRYPLIHPTWVFLRALGANLDEIRDEERRLFYVAVTRAQQSLTLITHGDRQTEYLLGIDAANIAGRVDWAKLPSGIGIDDKYFDVHVSNGFPVKDDLKRHGFTWNPADKTWRKAIPVDRYTPSEIRQDTWLRAGVSVTVLTETGEIVDTFPGLDPAPRG